MIVPASHELWALVVTVTDPEDGQEPDWRRDTSYVHLPIVAWRVEQDGSCTALVPPSVDRIDVLFIRLTMASWWSPADASVFSSIDICREEAHLLVRLNQGRS